MPDKKKNGKKEQSYAEMIEEIKKKINSYLQPIKPGKTVPLGGGRGQLERALEAQGSSHTGGKKSHNK